VSTRWPVLQVKMDNQEDRRIITSAIDGMSVAEVRRALSTMRKSWEECSGDKGSKKPFYMTSDPIVRGLSVQEFSYMFVRGHHTKRLNKSKSSGSVAILQAVPEPETMPHAQTTPTS
jgi:hypothetical protein